MGIIINSLQLATTQDIYRLVVLVDKPTGEEISINKKLSEALIKLKPTQAINVKGERPMTDRSRAEFKLVSEYSPTGDHAELRQPARTVQGVPPGKA